MRTLIILLLMTASYASFAQEAGGADTKDTTGTPEKTHFVAGILYHSGLNYYGRVDSLHSKGICPFLGVSLKNGLYLNTTFVFIRNSLQSQYAATLLEAGYSFINKKKNWTGTFSVSRFFYQGDIDLIQSAVKEAASASITHLNKVMNITLGINAKWSDKTDLGLQTGLDHIFRVPRVFGGDVLVIDPSFTVFAGTQNFTSTYYQQKKFLFLPVGQEQVTTDSRAFHILAYEASLPVIYGYRWFNLIFSPAWVSPQHLITVPGQPELSERGENLLYVTVTLKLTL